MIFLHEWIHKWDTHLIQFTMLTNIQCGTCTSFNVCCDKNRKIAPRCDSYLNAILLILLYKKIDALYSRHYFYSMYSMHCIIRNVLNAFYSMNYTDQQTNRPTDQQTDGKQLKTKQTKTFSGLNHWQMKGIIVIMCYL